MYFEFDAEKSRRNKEKHGIDFIEAQGLFANEPLFLPPTIIQDEERILVIGKIDATFWTVIITMRAGVIRIISCRRSRDDERKLYE